MKRWVVSHAAGTALERVLNEMEDSGIAVHQIIHYATAPQQNPLDPSRAGLIPMFVVIGRPKMTLLEDADA